MTTQARELAKIVNILGVKALPYHAKLDNRERENTQNLFTEITNNPQMKRF